MKASLFLLLTTVAAVIFWTAWTQAFTNPWAFSLGCLAVGLCGYLIADYFMTNERKNTLAESAQNKKEIAALKEEIDILNKQAALGIPQTELDDLRKRLYYAEEEGKKISGEFLAQASHISLLNVRLEKAAKENIELKEETKGGASRLTELDSVRDTLTSTKNRITELDNENIALKNELELHNQTSAVGKPNDLKVIEGIGSKIEKLLHSQGINTWQLLAETNVENLRDILHNAGEAYYLHKPTTWPAQATLLAQGHWAAFEAYNAHIPQSKEPFVAPKIEENTAEIVVEKAVETPLVFDFEAPKMTENAENAQNTEGVEPDKIVFLKDKTENVPYVSHRKKSRSIPIDDSAINPESKPLKNTQLIDKQAVTASKQGSSIGEGISAEQASKAEPHPIYGLPDNLKIIEGIGPKIEAILKEAGIETWHTLAEVNVENLKGILEKAGSRFRLNDPTSWPEQAKLLSIGEFDKFKKLTDQLIGGKKTK